MLAQTDVCVPAVAIILTWAQYAENTRVGKLSIIDPGNSDNITSMPEQTGKK